MNDKLQCFKHIFEPGSTFKGRPCYKPVKVTVDGKHYCATHSPAAVAKRRAASEAKYNETLERGRMYAERVATEQHKAACFDELVQACATMLGCAEIDCMDDKSNVWRSAMLDARAALDKARNV